MVIRRDAGTHTDFKDHRQTSWEGDARCAGTGSCESLLEALDPGIREEVVIVIRFL
jgi:hypothetical protein